ncbi:MAG: beta-lactamase family protein, partial [Saprospiraceae bacterium]|nr:beta-lactamase family protein [Saprospiraceae bacterium]
MKTTTISLCSLIIAGNIFAQGTPSVTDQIKTYLQQYEAAGYHGSVLAASKGKILVEQGYGLADREAGRKQDAETVFCIGSITKQFTAAGIVKLESMGKIRVEDALSTYFPDAPADKAKITIHQLLTHTAGFPGAIGDDYETVNTQQFLKLAWETPLLTPPGTQYEYSNVGYSILGILIEKISGKSYDAFLREHLWLPAGMKQTGYLLPGFKKENLAVGYEQDKRWGTALDHAWLVDGPGWHLRANGGVLSTVGDMYRWYLALKKHVVMPESAVKKLFTPYVKEGPNAPSYYGYGWVVQQAGEKQVIWHNGG